MRSHSDEHAEALPVLDVSAMRHVAYVFDALVYCMRSGNDIDGEMMRDGVSVQSWQDHEETMTDDADDDLNQNATLEAESDADSDTGTRLGKKHPFFQRSESTTFPGCISPDPFVLPLCESIPLADKPQLLHPNARKEELFGVPKQALPSQDGSNNNLFDLLPTRLAVSSRRGPGSLFTAPSLLIQSLPGELPTFVPSGILSASTSVIVKPINQQIESGGCLLYSENSSTAQDSIESSQLKPVDMTIANMERLQQQFTQPGVIMQSTIAQPSEEKCIPPSLHLPNDGNNARSSSDKYVLLIIY